MQSVYVCLASNHHRAEFIACHYSRCLLLTLDIVQVLMGTMDFWYNHLAPAWALLDMHEAQHGPRTEQQSSDMQELITDLQALAPLSEPANGPRLRELSAKARKEVRLVLQW